MPKISELPLANKLKEEDYIPIVQDGVTKKVKGTHFVTEEEYSLDAFSPTIAANDKTMYKFGEGDTVDFSDSAYDGAYKSAILKGMTETILDRFENGTYNAWSPTFIKGDNTKRIRTINQYSGVSGSITVSVNEKYEVNVVGHNTSTSTGIGGEWQTTLSIDVTNSIFAFIIRKKDGTDITKDEIHDVNLVTSFKQLTDMVSVKMPVLKTVGKNLFNGEIVDGYYADGTLSKLISASGGVYKSIKLYLKKGSYTLSTDQSIRLVREMKDGVFSITGGDYLAYNFTLETDCLYVLSFRKTDNTVFNLTNIQLEESTTATTYEPYKSNILSTPSDLELRGIGNVYDELDILNSQSIQRRALFNTYSNSNVSRFGTYGDVTRFTIISTGCKPGSHNETMCNLFSLGVIGTENLECFSVHGADDYLIVQIKTSKLKSDTADGFVEWANDNGLEFDIVLKEEVHKTVDLSGTPFGYKGGHIIKSSAEGSLLPKFEYEVAVSRGAQISQNTSTLIKHDEKITELLKKTAATYINQKAEIAYLLNMSSTLEEVQTIPFIEDDYVNDDCMVDSDMVMDNMEVEPEKEIIDNVDTLLINLIYDLIELNDTLGLSEKVELFRQSGLIDKHNYEIIKEKLNPTFKEEDYADINQ